MLLVLPSSALDDWPSLGEQVGQRIQEGYVHGPGAKGGQPVELSPLQWVILDLAYQVFPRSHPEAGRRRWKTVVLEMTKGGAKTEIGALIAAVEADPLGPVRTVGWDGDLPLGGPLRDPYVPMLATTEEQSEDLAFGVLHQILSEPACSAADEFRVTLELVTRADGTGKIQPLAASPSARDGALTSFQLKDESHHMKTAKMHKAAATMRQNLYKRFDADPWELELTNRPEPLKDSVGEASLNEALAADRRGATEGLLYIAVRGDEQFDGVDDQGEPLINDPEVRRAAIESTRAGLWPLDTEPLVREWDDTRCDRGFYQRLWLGWPKLSEPKWWAPSHFHALPRQLEAGELITVGFDGSRTDDTTWFVACTEDGHVVPLREWSRPQGWPRGEPWKVPDVEVDGTLAEIMHLYGVVQVYADPSYWRDWLATWQGRWPDLVVAFETGGSYRKMAHSLHETQVSQDTFTFAEGRPLDAELRRHVLAAVRARPALPTWLDRDQGVEGYILGKPEDGSKIDGAMAAALAIQARRDATAGGLWERARRARRRRRTIAY